MREYYALFPALKMSRQQLMERIWPVLREHQVTLDDEAECEEVSFDIELQRYQWTGRACSYEDIDDALSRTCSWQGLVLYFRYVVEDVMGELSVILWNDAEPDVTTLVICENSALFNLQREQVRAWTSFQQILISMVVSLRAAFCFMQCEPPLRTLGGEMISDALERVAKGRLVPIFLAVLPESFPRAAFLPAPPGVTRYDVRRERGYLIISNPQMGSPELEM